MSSQTTSDKRNLLKGTGKWVLLIALAVLATVLSSVRASAQIVVVNPLEWAALIEGNEVMHAEMKDEIQGETETAVLQNTIAAEFSQIKKWEKKYNGYLKCVDGYASSIKAASHLYNDGVMLFINLCNVKKAVESNPQGIVATFSMNNLYVETAAELVSVYTTLRDAIDTGGNVNMLTGAERSETLWALNDRLDSFNHKLSLLTLSLRYYTLTDVWNNVTEGLIERSNGDIATQAQTRWMRAAKVARSL